MNTFRPAVMLGRGVTSRVATDASSGSTWYFSASLQNRSCSSFSLSGFFAATSSRLRPVACEVVELPRVRRPGPVDRRRRCTHGGRITLVLAIQPSW